MGKENISKPVDVYPKVSFWRAYTILVVIERDCAQSTPTTLGYNTTHRVLDSTYNRFNILAYDIYDILLRKRVHNLFFFCFTNTYNFVLSPFFPVIINNHYQIDLTSVIPILYFEVYICIYIYVYYFRYK